jgi:peptidoglycan/LPS O-acetylase OafA/YrhL
MIHLKYRPDIDGLRAVAVLGVVIYHAFPWIIPGGFIGVDIFFVISGYLISGILYKGHRAGNFSFKEFYARRIRRLFPALITMLVLSLILGHRLLLTNEFQELGRQVAAGTFFLQNFLFWQESGYFDRAAELKPLLHLWSLAVEEQFYIFFPPLLILLWKKPKFLVPVMGVLLIATFILNLVMSVQNGVTDFFLTPYRAWEFLGGSLLAWWHYDRGHEEEAPLYREAMSFAGLILLVVGLTFIHKGDPYPGWRAVLPVAGTLLLMEGGRGAWINSKILSNPAVVWIGLISYPLYLFHWPLLSFVRITLGKVPNFWMTLSALGISLILSVTTFYLIEQRVRFSFSRWTVPVLIGLFAALGIAGLLCMQGILSPRSSSLGFDEVVAASQDIDYFKGYSRSIVQNYYSLYKAGGSGPKTLFVGDSHMEQCAPRILEVIDNGHAGNRGAIFLTKGGCPPIPELFNGNKEQGKYFLTREILQLGLSPDVDRVVIGANWCYYFNWGSDICSIHDHLLSSEQGRKEAMASLSEMILFLRGQGKKVYLLLSFPTNNEVDPLATVERSLTGNFSIKKVHFAKKEFLDLKGLMSITQQELMNRFEVMAVEAGAEVIKPMDVLEKNGEFPWRDGMTPYFHDGAHYTASFMRKNAFFLDKLIELQGPHQEPLK